MDTRKGHTCELALPAGSLQCALYAFKGGAHAVYFGLKEFSARKGAVNFSFEDARKLKAWCRKNDRKFYIALNTIVDDSQLVQVVSMLRQLEYLAPDGLIVQDLGIARIIHEKFPTLPLHGSTQLAVHTVNGVKELQRLGFTRVVLSRELSFEEISEIRTACPDIELKVFIHGALCYGFSGLCMTSQVLTGRSANCGACAQVCRTWFTCRETGTDSWLFSMKDLCLGDLVRKYREIGIDSLKIEGRMKGPDYSYWCARYYSLLLDGASEEDQDVIWAKQAMQVSFSRDTTTGFFCTGHNGSRGSSCMVCADDPTHRGIRVGTIDKVLGGKAVVRFEQPVAIRDGLKVTSSGKSVGFSLTSIDGGRSFISEGQTATINFPTASFERKPGFGTPLFCISRHDLNPGLLNENIPLFKKPLDMEVVITDSGISMNGTFFPVEVQQARSHSDLQEIFTKVLEASDRSFFTLGKLTVRNNSSFEDPFIPMSVLKQARRACYDRLDSEFEEYVGNQDTVSASTVSGPIASGSASRHADLPKRSLLGLWDKVCTIDGKSYLCLSPLMFNEKDYLEKLDMKLAENPGLIVGLNNIAQLSWARRNPSVKVFADFFLYTENHEAYALLSSELENLIGSYELDPDTPFTYTGDDFVPPLFTSRVCLRHNGLGLACSSCSRDNTFHLEQNGKHYKAICRDCTTVVVQQ